MYFETGLATIFVYTINYNFSPVLKVPFVHRRSTGFLVFQTFKHAVGHILCLLCFPTGVSKWPLSSCGT